MQPVNYLGIEVHTDNQEKKPIQEIQQRFQTAGSAIRTWIRVHPPVYSDCKNLRGDPAPSLIMESNLASHRLSNK